MNEFWIWISWSLVSFLMGYIAGTLKAIYTNLLKESACNMVDIAKKNHPSKGQEILDRITKEKSHRKIIKILKEYQ